MRTSEHLITVREAVHKREVINNVPYTYLFMKRTLDIFASATGIILLSPLLLAVAALIRLESEGPVFFRQERIGHNGKIFHMIKFRSMVKDAEKLLKELESRNEVKGHMFKIREDPRITRIGKFIRKTSIDELPQLFNVLRGEMSIVGPRPPITREVLNYGIWHNLRMSVKPGMTGLWQISGRNNIGFDEMVRLDLKYIRERCFFYDLKIILKTLPVLLGDSKAF